MTTTTRSTNQSTKFYVDNSGKYLGGYTSTLVETIDISDPDHPETVGSVMHDPVIPAGAVEVAGPPTNGDARSTWNGSAWVDQDPDPDGTGFEQAVKSAVGGIVAANALATKYPLLHPAVQQQRWADVQALIVDAHQQGVLSDGQYAGFSALASTYHIPITL